MVSPELEAKRPQRGQKCCQARRGIEARRPPLPGARWPSRRSPVAAGSPPFWRPGNVVGPQRHSKHEEYLRVSVRENWILDTEHRRMHALVREGHTWEETIVPESGIYHTVFLPGLQAQPAELLGPASVL